MNRVTQRELSFLLLLWGLSDPRIAELREMPWSFSIKLHSEPKSLAVWASLGVAPLDMLRTPYRWRAKGNALNNPPCPITPTLTSSSVHHFISSIDYNVFIVSQCHLKDRLCRKAMIYYYYIYGIPYNIWYIPYMVYTIYGI